MGKNGSGKSTLAKNLRKERERLLGRGIKERRYVMDVTSRLRIRTEKVLVGHPDYEVTGGSVVFKGENLVEMEPEERSLAGLFMSFQSH
ncbi:hypothetical protein ACB098_07G147600 [Castanea mollissima]